MPIEQSLKYLDTKLFEVINRDYSFLFLDHFMLLLRNPLTWIPFYLFFLYWCIVHLKINAWAFIFCSILGVAFTDSTTAFLLKPFFERLRPCYEPSLIGIVRILDGCGGKYSFPSNHAANHFMLASFWFLSIKHLTGKKWYFLWIWAFVICYAQVYVGKHYPGDILGGALFGIIAALLSYRLFLLIVKQKLFKS